jgi:hypothetical protein
MFGYRLNAAPDAHTIYGARVEPATKSTMILDDHAGPVVAASDEVKVSSVGELGCTVFEGAVGLQLIQEATLERRQHSPLRRSVVIPGADEQDVPRQATRSASCR